MYILILLFKWLIDYDNTQKAIRKHDLSCGTIKSDDYKRKHGLLK